METPVYPQTGSHQRRHVEIIRTLCGIVAELVDIEARELCRDSTPASGDQSSSAAIDSAEHELSLPMILAEFGLSSRQVLMLRRRAEFPKPFRRGRRGLFFKRSEVERWIANQPDPGDPTAVLQRRKGTPSRSVRVNRDGNVISIRSI